MNVLILLMKKYVVAGYNGLNATDSFGRTHDFAQAANYYGIGVL